MTVLLSLSVGCNLDSSDRDEDQILNVDDSSSEEGCIPHCEGKDCGDDGCGDLCGVCANQLCAPGECVEGRCVNTSLDDQTLSCNGFALSYCSAGAFEVMWCPDVCRESGNNTAYGCGVSGTSSDRCNCGNIDEICSQNIETCLSDTELFLCDAADNFFYQVDCEGACKSLGHAGSFGCANDRCYCYDLDANNHRCLPAEESCESGAGVLACCPGLACINNGYTSRCRERTPCRDQCMSPSGNVCCGGGNCSGDCIGNPCCS